jgi:hypothetical protein
MPYHLLLVFTAAVPGREEEYHRWYDERHLDDILALPGFVSARRYDGLQGPRSATAPPTRNLAVYEIEGDPLAALEALNAARPELNVSTALAAGTSVWLFAVHLPAEAPDPGPAAVQ